MERTTTRAGAGVGGVLHCSRPDARVARPSGQLGRALALASAASMTVAVLACESGRPHPSRTDDVSSAAAVSAVASSEPSGTAPAASMTARSQLELAELTQRCRAICEKTASMNCPAHASCVPGCVQSFGVRLCAGALRAFLKCTEASDVADFECAPTGIPALLAGRCEAEQRRVVACVERSARPTAR